MEIVYLLTNPAMPGLVKIGRTSYEDVGRRLASLYTTGVPLPFELVFACRVQNALVVEAALHRAFAPNRLNPGREYFRIEVEQALAIMKLLHVEEVTGDVGEKMDAETPPAENAAREVFSKARRPNMNFLEMGLVVGSELISADTGEAAIIHGPRKVIFRNQEVYLTEATRKARGLPAGYSIQPSPFWTYNDTFLSDLYEKTYSATSLDQVDEDNDDG